MSRSRNWAKASRLQRQLEDQLATTHASANRQHAVYEQRQQYEAEETRQRLYGTHLYRIPTTEGGVATEKTSPVQPEILAGLARVRQDEAEIRKHTDALREASKPLGAIVTRCKELSEADGVDPRDWGPPVPLVRPAGPPPDVEQLDDVRGLIRDLKNRSKAAARANVSESEAHQGIDAWLDAQAAALDESGISVFTSPTGDIRQHRLFSRDDGPMAGTYDRQQIQALLATIARPALRANRVAAAARYVETRGGWGPPAAERTALRAALEAELFAAEVREEQLIETFEAYGMSMPRRADADVRAVLWVEPAPVKAAEPASAMA